MGVACIDSNHIEQQQRNTDFVTKHFYDAGLEFLNEMSDILLMLHLHRKWCRTGDVRARGLFVASVVFFTLELVVRICLAIFNYSASWVPIRCCPNFRLRLPPCRHFQRDLTHCQIYGLMIVVVLEPNIGSYLLQRYEDETTIDATHRIKAADLVGMPDEATRFIEQYRDEEARLVTGRELFFMFLIEDLPELVIEMLLVLLLDQDEMTFVWWLSTMSTVGHLLRHGIEFLVDRQLLHSLQTKLPEVFHKRGQLKRVGSG